MYKFLLILISIALIAACTSTEEKAADAKKGLTEEQKKIMLRKSEHVVDKSMELMDLPEYGIKTLTKKGDYQSKELLDAFTRPSLGYLSCRCFSKVVQKETVATDCCDSFIVAEVPSSAPWGWVQIV